MQAVRTAFHPSVVGAMHVDIGRWRQSLRSSHNARPCLPGQSIGYRYDIGGSSVSAQLVGWAGHADRENGGSNISGGKAGRGGRVGGRRQVGKGATVTRRL